LANVVRKNSADWNGIFTVGWMTRLKASKLGKITVVELSETDLFTAGRPNDGLL